MSHTSQASSHRTFHSSFYCCVPILSKPIYVAQDTTISNGLPVVLACRRAKISYKPVSVDINLVISQGRAKRGENFLTFRIFTSFLKWRGDYAEHWLILSSYFLHLWQNQVLNFFQPTSSSFQQYRIGQHLLLSANLRPWICSIP